MIVYFREHELHTMNTHPENARRFEKLGALLERERVHTPEPAAEEQVLRVHTREHLRRIKALSEAEAWADADTYLTRHSYRTALLAAGGAVLAAQLAQKHGHAFALVRPPGHHATPERAMGFCLFNNIAIACAEMLAGGMKRVVVLDVDVHHGNGTQEVFYSSPEVLFISLHQHPLYPGTGMPEETGRGEGEGYTVNIPLPPGTGDADYLQALELALDIAVQHSPELVLVSAGYDTASQDPLGGMMLTSRCYAEIGRRLRRFPAVCFCLEGGYSSSALAAGVESTLSGIRGQSQEYEPGESTLDLSHVRRVLRNYWSA
ncbi:MAG: histone deacetylase [Euryarchaeota archaeon]|nr:histone deacetylase [Euryarchaeota archaeon]